MGRMFQNKHCNNGLRQIQLEGKDQLRGLFAPTHLGKSKNRKFWKKEKQEKSCWTGLAVNIYFYFAIIVFLFFVYIHKLCFTTRKLLGERAFRGFRRFELKTPRFELKTIRSPRVHAHASWKLVSKNEVPRISCQDKNKLNFLQIFHRSRKPLGTFKQSDSCQINILKKWGGLVFFYALVSLGTI